MADKDTPSSPPPDETAPTSTPAQPSPAPDKASPDSEAPSRGGQMSPDAQPTTPKTGSSFGHKLADAADAASEAGGGGGGAAQAGKAAGASALGSKAGRAIPRGRPAGPDAAAAANPRKPLAGIQGKKAPPGGGAPDKGADERLAGTAGKTATRAAADSLTGGAWEKARSAPVVGGLARAAENAGGMFTQKTWKVIKWAAAGGFGLLLAGFLVFITTVVIPPAVDTDNPGDACMNEIYDPNLTLPTSMNREQKETVRDILKTAYARNMGLNTAAFATVVAYAEHGLDNGADDDPNSSDPYVGSFQQSVLWHTEDGAPCPKCGTSADPRLDVSDSATRFMWAWRDILKSGGKASSHENQTDILNALASLGVDVSNPDKLWKAWKAADLTGKLTDPANADAMLVLTNAIQGYDADVTPLGVLNHSLSRDGANYKKKTLAAAPFINPILESKGAAAAADAENINQMYADSQLVDSGFAAPEYSDEDRPQAKGVFVMGDSLTNGIADDLEDAGYSVDAETGRLAEYAKFQEVLKTPKAQAAEVWIIELGTNNDGGAAPGNAQGWVKTVKGLRNKNAPQKVYWVLPWRPENYNEIVKETGGGFPLGSAQPIADALRAEANAATSEALATGGTRADAWLAVLDWAKLAEEGDLRGWFDEDEEQHIHPNSRGDASLIDLMLVVTTGNLTSDDIYDSCIGGNSDGMTIAEARAMDGAVVFDQEDRGPVRDGVVYPDAELWVPNVLNRSKEALIDPPCEKYGCAGWCGHLSGKVHGLSNSGFDDARAQWLGFEAMGLAHYASDPDGLRPSVGSMLFFNNGDYGHVVTYVGDGMVVSNDYLAPNKGSPWVVMRPAWHYINAYKPYLGWADPPKSWRPRD